MDHIYMILMYAMYLLWQMYCVFDTHIRYERKSTRVSKQRALNTRHFFLSMEKKQLKLGVIVVAVVFF